MKRQVAQGATIWISATVRASDGTPVQAPRLAWSASDTAIATVDSNGVVYGHTVGATMLTVVSKTYPGVSATDTITVVPAPYLLSIQPYLPWTSHYMSVGELLPGEQMRPAATVRDLACTGAGTSVVCSYPLDSIQHMTWVSRNPDVASFDSSGMLTAHAAGTARIVAISDIGRELHDSADVIVLASPIRFTQVTAGGNQCGLTASGAAYCWSGAPAWRGDGSGALRIGPTPVAGGLSFSSLSTSDNVQYGLFSSGTMLLFPANTCGITADHSAYCWGYEWGTNAPARVSAAQSFHAVAVGPRSVCALAADSTAYCWGENSSGQLGDGTYTAHASPAPVASNVRFLSIAVSGGACAISADSTAYCWGGLVGDSTNTSAIVPTAVPGFKFVEVAVGFGYACARTAANQVYCWGNNDVGNLGDNTSTTRYAPTLVAGGLRFTSVSTSHFYTRVTCGIAFGGSGYCWGNNCLGSLGDGTTTSRSYPVPVAGGHTFTSLAAGRVSCGLTSSGVYCWGANDDGGVGDNTVGTRTTPARVAGQGP